MSKKKIESASLLFAAASRIAAKNKKPSNTVVQNNTISKTKKKFKTSFDKKN